MEDITITNQKGESVCLGRQGPFFLEKVGGLGELGVGIESQKAPYQDGSTYINNTLENRALSMEGMIITKSNPGAVPTERRRMQRVLNPKLGEVVIAYRRGEAVKEIRGIAESTPVFPEGRGLKGHHYQKFLLHLICHQPFWLDQYTESREIVTWIGGMTFPLSLPSRFAMKGMPVINVFNKGDVKTPVEIKFQGPATNPKIANRTIGEYIQVRKNLSSGDTLLVTTDFGAKRVEINGVNAFHHIDLNSIFWQLQPGDNIVKYTSDEPSEPAAVVISYRNRYVGV